MAAKADDNIFECTICLETFEEPKLLPCFHTFCKKCLSTHIQKSRRKGNVFPCPNCRTEIKVPPKGAEGFQTNFYVMAARTSEAKMKNKLIEMSLTAAAKATAKSDDSKLFDQPCPKHSTHVLQFYCIPCDIPICIPCKLTSHEGHDTRDLEDIIHKTKGELKVLSDKMTSYVDLYKAARDSTAELDKKIDHKLQTLKASVIGNAEHLHDMVDNRKKILLDTINKNQRKEANKVVQYKKDLEKTSKQISGLVTNISTEQNKHDIVALLKLKSSMEDQIKKLDTSPPDFTQQMEDMVYERKDNPTAKTRESISNFLGQIKICPPGTSSQNGPRAEGGAASSSRRPAANIKPQVHHYVPTIGRAIIKEEVGKPVLRSLVSDTKCRIWAIYDPIGPIVEQFNKHGATLNKVSIGGKDVSGITLLPSNMMVISCPSQKILCNLTGLETSTFSQSFRANLPETPVTVYFYSGQVYVLLCGKGSAKGLFNPDRVSWMFRNGLLKKPFDFVVKHVAGKLTSVITDPQGQQVVFLQDNNQGGFTVKSIYKGEGVDNPSLFCPKGISATNRGYVLVADEGNKLLLHIDEERGVLIGLVRLEFLAINKPRLVRYSKQYGVWVTTTQGGVYMIKYPNQIPNDIRSRPGTAEQDDRFSFLTL